VGKARFDAEHGVDHILKYLDGAAKKISASAAEVLNQIRSKGIEAVTKDEHHHAWPGGSTAGASPRPAGVQVSTNEEMLRAISAKVAG